MPRLSQEALKKEKRSSTSKDDKGKGKTSSIGENCGKSSERKRSDAKKSTNVASKKVQDKGEKKSKKVKEEVGSGREEGELESTDEDDDKDPYADQTKFR